jgi:tetratricopeptide (TPR) repeat protein
MLSLQKAPPAEQAVLKTRRLNLHKRSHILGVIRQAQAPVCSLSGRTARDERGVEPLSADDWFDLGIDLEVSAPDEAQGAYRRALAMDPGHTNARVNLGRLLQEMGELAEAARHYRTVLETEPAHPIAAFNLGTVFEKLGRLVLAIGAYRRAVEADAEFADAHFNLSRLYERAGKRRAALRHLMTYKVLSENQGRIPRWHARGGKNHDRNGDENEHQLAHRR